MKIKSGATLVEVLAATAIVAFIVSVFAPQVLQSRQKVRQAACANNLKRVTDGWLAHEQALGYLPSSGWGWRWTGDPDRGFGRSQPGGWAFDAIRFTEYSKVANLGVGLPDADKASEMVRANGTPIPIFYCPDRRPVSRYPLVRNGSLANNLGECRVEECSVARIDYQANSGNIAAGETGGPGGGRSRDALDFSTFGQWNGVTYQASQLRLAQIEDGLSKTMCVGEKYLNVDNYSNGADPADDNSHFIGLDRDVNGYTASANSTRDMPLEAFLPRRDIRGLGLNWTFGSAHEGGFNAANCDGSVRFLSYDIDFVVFYLLGGRADSGFAFQQR